MRTRYIQINVLHVHWVGENLPTHYRHFARNGNFQYFITTKPLTKSNFTYLKMR